MIHWESMYAVATAGPTWSRIFLSPWHFQALCTIVQVQQPKKRHTSWGIDLWLCFKWTRAWQQQTEMSDMSQIHPSIRWSVGAGHDRGTADYYKENLPLPLPFCTLPRFLSIYQIWTLSNKLKFFSNLHLCILIHAFDSFTLVFILNKHLQLRTITVTRLNVACLGVSWQ